MSSTRLLVIVMLLAAAPRSVPAHGADFLTLFPDGRNSAMAGAGAAMSGCAASAFYNPAGLAFVRSPDMLIEYYKMSPYGPPVWNTAAAVPLNARVGTALFAGGSEYYPDGLGVDDIVTREYEVGVCASGAAFGWLAVGVNLKYIGSRQHHYLSYLDSAWALTSYALAADGGILARFHTGFGRLGFGLAVRNLGTKMGFAGQPMYATPLPGLTIAGAEWSVTAKDLGQTGFLTFLPAWLFPQDWQIENMGWTVAYDLRNVHGEDYSLPYDYSLQSLGFELRPIPFLAARIGRVYTNQAYGWPDPGFTWGLGLDLRYLRIDLSEDHQLAMLGYWGPSRYRISASLNIGEPLVRPGGLLGPRG